MEKLSRKSANSSAIPPIIRPNTRPFFLAWKHWKKPSGKTKLKKYPAIWTQNWSLNKSKASGKLRTEN